MTPLAPSARSIAFEVLLRVEEGGAFASRALDAALGRAGALPPREAGLATALVYGTLRRTLQLDALLGPHCSRPWPSSTRPPGCCSAWAPTSWW